jgi:hypothetical protein
VKDGTISTAEKVGANLSRDDHVQALSEETKPQQLVQQIKAREEK